MRTAAPPPLSAAEPALCGRCGGPRRPGWRFAFPDGEEQCLWCALRHRSLVRRAGPIALLVGTALLAINQGDAVLSGHFSGALLWKIPLTYLVPYCVSTYATLSTLMRR